MLPKKNRLTKKNDFDAVFRKGVAVKSDFLILKTLKNNLKESRFGFVVSKKVSAKATVRNKIKRRLRDAVFQKIAEIKNSVDAVAVVLPGAEKKDFLEIKNTINNLFSKLKII